MTGEITLTGKVLPVGGIKEKALAAMRMNIDTVIIPYKNKKDLEDIPDEFRQKLQFIPVKTIDEVLDIALIDWAEKKKKVRTSGGGNGGNNGKKPASNKKKKGVGNNTPMAA
jgi:ATP-dependent Lon protease